GATVPRCPIGASLSADPGELPAARKLDELEAGLRAYAEAGCDFLEINESCPNTEESRDDEAGGLFDKLVERLRHVSSRFLARRDRPLPVIVKFSTDTDPEQIPHLLDVLLELGFDGVNFGNTSTDYAAIRSRVRPEERRLYDHFVARYGGGVSGRPLKGRSLALVRAAADYLVEADVEREFHVVRTGGVETAADVTASLAAGASLVQWYTGYFEAFARYGHRVYHELYEGLVESAPAPRAEPATAEAER
ncbi:MAG: hypothetical protein MI919_17075, partial [Holophagales bacterium]|nr:hypothetical protein [Holophagales bacterium]